MFNFTANHLIWINSVDYDKARVSLFKDADTNRSYKVYDYQKWFEFSKNKLYCLSGKLNSADKLYLILERAKEDKQYGFVKDQNRNSLKVPNQGVLGT